MELIGRGLNKAHKRQKTSLLKEAQAAGCEVLSFEETNQQDDAGKTAIATSLKAFTGGKMKLDSWQLMTLETAGLRHVFVQPFSGMSPMPGEHHAILKGTAPSTVALVQGVLGKKWESPDAAFATVLNKERRELKMLAKKCEFEWGVGMGKIVLEWALQMFSRGNGSTQCVMQTGRYGGFTSYGVGFRQYLALVCELSNVLSSDARGPNTPAYNISYASVAEAMLTGNAPSAETLSTPEPSTGPEPSTAIAQEESAPTANLGAQSEYSDLIRAVMGPHKGKKILVDDLPEKKERNVRERVLPPTLRDEKLIAVLDLTTFGSCKDAIALTPTHCHVHEFDVRISFAFADVQAVHGFSGMLKSKVEIDVRNTGSVKIPCAGELAGNPLLELLNQIVG